MDFIERLFGIAPDGGSGTTEAMILLTILIAATPIWHALRLRQGR